MTTLCRKTTTLLFLTLLLIIFIPNACGIGLSPQEMTLRNLARGQEYERKIVVYNTKNYTENFSLWAEGVGSEWITFYTEEDTNHTTPLNTIAIPGKSHSFVTVLFRIPDNATNGIYNPQIFVQTAPPEGEGGGQTVSLMLSTKVTLVVTGEQNLTGTVLSLTTEDVERGELLHIIVEFVNTGNVDATPEITVNIIKGKGVVDTVTFAETRLKPKTRKLIPVKWDTSGRELGNYTAQVNVSLGGNLIYTGEVQFALKPFGVVSTRGNITKLSYEGELIVGNTIKIIAYFKNMGKAAVSAKFIGELYHDGKFIRNFESNEVLVERQYHEEPLTIYLPLEEIGRYEIKGYVFYENKDIGVSRQTEVLTLSFEARSATPVELLTGAVAGIIILTTVMYYTIRQKKLFFKGEKAAAKPTGESLRQRRSEMTVEVTVVKNGRETAASTKTGLLSIRGRKKNSETKDR
ncbi:MAG TPA: hypothetical protein EYP23_04100 [Thermoplasmata archaeon]|nr:hypothetical protein [Thermoplasmata archaeon]